MRRLIPRRHLLPLLLSIAILNCGGSTLLKSFRIALASSSPLVNSLVASGAIPNTKATAIIADFDAGAQCGLTLQNDFNAAGESRSAKFAASSKALTCFRVIINRQNFAAHPRIQQAANIAEGILNSLVIFYSDTPSSDPTAARAPISEEAFEKRVEAQIKALKESLKP